MVLWSIRGSIQDAAGAVSLVILLVVLYKLLASSETVHSRRLELAVAAGALLIYVGLFAYAYRDVGRAIGMLGNSAIETHIAPGLYLVTLGLILFVGSTVMRRR